MTARSYFGKMNSTLGSVVPLAMFAQYVVLVRDGQGSYSFYQAFWSRERKNTSGLSGEMSSVDNFLGKVDSEKFPQNRLLIA